MVIGSGGRFEYNMNPRRKAIPRDAIAAAAVVRKGNPDG
jgi:hypothetical protein